MVTLPAWFKQGADGGVKQAQGQGDVRVAAAWLVTTVAMPCTQGQAAQLQEAVSNKHLLCGCEGDTTSSEQQLLFVPAG